MQILHWGRIDFHFSGKFSATFCSTGNILENNVSIFSLGTEALGNYHENCLCFSINIQKTGYGNNH